MPYGEFGRLPSLTGLMTFDAVARHLSFSKAGREFHITQAAVSHRIRSLEGELGIRLFSRTPRAVELTDAGAVLFRSTRVAFTQLRQGLTEMHALGDPSRVTVSCSPSFAIRWLVPHMSQLRAAAPNVDLHVSAEDDLVQPRRGVIDCCIRFGSGGWPNVDAERLKEESLTPVCSPLYAASHGVTDLKALHSCQLLHDDVLMEHEAHIGWREWFEHTEHEWNAPMGLHFSHSHLALDAAAAGLGVALGRHTLIRAHLRAGLLVAPAEMWIQSSLAYWLVLPRGTPPTPAVQIFVDWLRESLQR